MNNKFEISLLTYEDYAKFDMPFGFDVESTDFAALLGTSSHHNHYCKMWCKCNYYVDANKNFNNEIRPCIDSNGSSFSKPSCDVSNAICPSFKFSQIKDLFGNVINFNYIGSWAKFYFGEYPKSLVYDKEIYYKLEDLYQNGELVKTGKVYTTDAPYETSNVDEVSYYHSASERLDFIPYHHEEYELDGHKYVRVSGYKNRENNYEFINHISNYFLDSTSDIFWVEVQPIEWEADVDLDIAIAKSALISGMKYHYDIFEGERLKNKKSISFEETAIYKYLNTYFAKEMLPQFIINKLYANNIYTSNAYNDMIGKKFK